LASHRRKYSLSHSHDAEEVGVELLLGFLNACFLQSPHQRVSRVIDENMQRVRVIQYALNCLLNRGCTGHIQANHLHSRDDDRMIANGAEDVQTARC
jgi:hypothetical protein